MVWIGMAIGFCLGSIVGVTLIYRSSNKGIENLRKGVDDLLGATEIDEKIQREWVRLRNRF